MHSKQNALAGGIVAAAPCGQNSAQMAVVAPHLRSTTTAMYEIWWTAGSAIGPPVAGAISVRPSSVAQNQYLS